jgi:hypothetical protein
MNAIAKSRSGSSVTACAIVGWAVVACSDAGMPRFSNANRAVGEEQPAEPERSGGTPVVPVDPIPLPPVAPGAGAGASDAVGSSGGPITAPPPPPEELPMVPPGLVCEGGRIAAGGVCLCSSGEFGAPELVTGLAAPGSFFGPSVSRDGFTIFLSVIDGVGADGPQPPNDNDEDILLATRSTRVAAFGPAAIVPGLDAGGTEEGTPFITLDGLSLYFFSTRQGPGSVGGRDIWVARRASVAVDFDPPTIVAGINSAELDHLPWLSGDQRQLLFVSDRPAPSGAGASNIWSALRDSADSAFGEPVELAGINTAAREEGFSLSNDGLTIVFASNRMGSADLDIWTATRPDPASQFSEPQNLSQLNSPVSDGDAMLSPDGLELFFSSERNGENQIFRAVRVCD